MSKIHAQELYSVSLLDLVKMVRKRINDPVIRKTKETFHITSKPIRGYKIALKKLPNILIVLRIVARFSDSI